MISKKDLKSLSEKNKKDADILFKYKRYSACMYLIGYSIELKLKHKICKILKLDNGYPENVIEFDAYNVVKMKDSFSKISVKSIKDLKTHNLEKLLKISGKEVDVKTKALKEWTLVNSWNPEMRYVNSKVLKNEALAFCKSISAVKNIIR